jgi:hypothetical protein
MLDHALDIRQTFPARPLRPDERDLVAEWLAAAGNVSSAYVSERRSDDPSIYRRIAISADGDGAFTHLIHAPFHSDVWIVLQVRHKPEIHQFETLLEALNFVRPVLGPSVGQPGGHWVNRDRQEVRPGPGSDVERRRLERPALDIDPLG